MPEVHCEVLSMRDCLAPSGPFKLLGSAQTRVPMVPVTRIHGVFGGWVSVEGAPLGNLCVLRWVIRLGRPRFGEATSENHGIILNTYWCYLVSFNNMATALREKAAMVHPLGPEVLQAASRSCLRVNLWALALKLWELEVQGLGAHRVRSVRSEVWGSRVWSSDLGSYRV